MAEGPHYVLGAQVAKLTVRLYQDSVFRSSITGEVDWSQAPVLMFNDDDSDIWTSTIDPTNPKRAIFYETATAVNARVNGEKVELWDGDTVTAAGSVSWKVKNR